jgi:hypothetical protein
MLGENKMVSLKRNQNHLPNNHPQATGLAQQRLGEKGHAHILEQVLLEAVGVNVSLSLQRDIHTRTSQACSFGP